MCPQTCSTWKNELTAFIQCERSCSETRKTPDHQLIAWTKFWNTQWKQIYSWLPCAIWLCVLSLLWHWWWERLCIINREEKSNRTQKWTGQNDWHLVEIVRNNCFLSSCCFFNLYLDTLVASNRCGLYSIHHLRKVNSTYWTYCARWGHHCLQKNKWGLRSKEHSPYSQRWRFKDFLGGWFAASGTVWTVSWNLMITKDFWGRNVVASVRKLCLHQRS